MTLTSQDQATYGAASELRRRLAVGWAESISIRGYRRTTVRHILESSGISRRVFYEHFGGKTEAFVAVHGDALAWLTDRIGAAAALEPDWPRKVAAGIASVLEGMARRPCEAQLLVGDPLAAGPRMGYCQELLVTRFAPGLAAGRRPGSAPPPPASLETALIGSLVDIVSRRLRSGSAHTLPSLGQQLTEFVLCPYLGPREAKRVARPSSSERSSSRGQAMAESQRPGNDFAAAFEEAFARLRARIEAACATQDDWPARVAVGVRAAFAFAVDHPEAARLLTCEALARGEEGQRQYRRMVSYFATLLLPGQDHAGNSGPPAIAESAMAAGVTLLVGSRLERGREDQLPAAAADAAQFMLIPYVGVDEAHKVATEHC